MCFFFFFSVNMLSFSSFKWRVYEQRTSFTVQNAKPTVAMWFFLLRFLTLWFFFCFLFFPHMLSPNFIKAMTMKEKSLNVKTYLSINLSLIRLIKTALQFIKRKEHFHWAQSLYKVRKKPNQNIITVRNSRMNAH